MRNNNRNMYQSRPSDHLAGSRAYYHGPIEPMDVPRASRRWLRTLLEIAAVAAVILAVLYPFMRADKANLCATEATAYKGCR